MKLRIEQNSNQVRLKHWENYNEDDDEFGAIIIDMSPDTVDALIPMLMVVSQQARLPREYEQHEIVQLPPPRPVTRLHARIPHPASAQVYDGNDVPR